MRGLFGRLFGQESERGGAPREFTLELPDWWAGGFGPAGYQEALTAFGRAHLPCRDRVEGLIDEATASASDWADFGVAYRAADACGPSARLVVAKDPLLAAGVLTPEEELDAYVAENLDDIRDPSDADIQLVGEPSVEIADGRYPGREVRWSLSLFQAPPTAITRYAYVSAGYIWGLEFSVDSQSPQDVETFSAIASSFRVTLPERAGSGLGQGPVKRASESVEAAIVRLVAQGGSMRVINESRWATMRVSADPTTTADVRLGGLLIVRTGVEPDVIEALDLVGFVMTVQPKVEEDLAHRRAAARARAIDGYSRYERTWSLPPDSPADIAADVRAAFTAILGRVPIHLGVESTWIREPEAPGLEPSTVIEPDGVSGFVARGDDRLAQGDMVGAMADFDRAVELHPDDGHAHGRRAIAHDREGEYSLGLADADAAISLEPLLADGHYARGLANAYLGHDVLAIADYTRAIELDGDSFLAYSGRGHAYLRQGDGRAALADTEWTIRSIPEWPALYAHRGWAKAISGDPAGATADFDLAESMTADPDEIGTIRDIRGGLGL